MEVDIITTDNTEINFAPADTVSEIVQNVRTICATPKYSVPMDRMFGVNAAIVDRPTPKAMAEIQAEIIAAIRKYEPRCKVKRVSFEGDLDGRLSVKVRILIKNEE
ncbi:MAG: GPW/gp25 family protein [Synergistaceae bacterium]|nr:GPW/gp25 family protein [Synergistaceae bacterium]